MKKDLLSMMDVTAGDVEDIIERSRRAKYSSGAVIYGEKQLYHPLRGKTLGMIIQTASTHTRLSFEAGMYNMGGCAISISTEEIQPDICGPLVDTANMLSRYFDGLMIRTSKHSDAVELAQYASIPVINGQTGYEHPCQVLGGFLTIHERKGGLEGIRVAYIGDGNSVANSLIAGGLICGMEVRIACPEGYEPHETVLKYAESNNMFSMTRDPYEAAEGADVVFTGEWPHTHEQQREDFAGYTVDGKLMSYAAKDAMVQHSLPARRGEEISADVFDKHSKEIYDGAQNRMHAQNAVMMLLMGDK